MNFAQFPSEVLCLVTNHLSGRSLCKLWMCGNWSLRDRMKHGGVRRFIVKESKTLSKWPSIVSEFDKLDFLCLPRIQSEAYLNDSLLPIRQLPKGIKTMAFYSGDFIETFGAFKRGVFDCNFVFPSLTSLNLHGRSIKGQELMEGMLPATLKSLRLEAFVHTFTTRHLPANLTELHVPILSHDSGAEEDESSLDFSKFAELEILTLDQLIFGQLTSPLPESLTELRLPLDDADDDDFLFTASMTSKLPPNLKTLSVVLAGSRLISEIFRALPRSIVDLELNFRSEEVVGKQELLELPPKLTRLRSTELIAFHCTQFLPATLQELELCTNGLAVDKDSDLNRLTFVAQAPTLNVVSPLPPFLVSLVLLPGHLNASHGPSLPATLTFLNIGSITLSTDGPKFPPSLTHLTTCLQTECPDRHPQTTNQSSGTLLPPGTVEELLEARRNGTLAPILPKKLLTLNLVFKSAVSLALLLPENLTHLSIVDLCEVSKKPDASRPIFLPGWSQLLPRSLEHLAVRVAHPYLETASIGHLSALTRLRHLEMRSFTRTASGFSSQLLQRLPPSLKLLHAPVAESFASEHLSMAKFSLLRRLVLIGARLEGLTLNFVNDLPVSLSSLVVCTTTKMPHRAVGTTVAQRFNEKKIAVRWIASEEHI